MKKNPQFTDWEGSPFGPDDGFYFDSETGWAGPRIYADKSCSAETCNEMCSKLEHLPDVEEAEEGPLPFD